MKMGSLKQLRKGLPLHPLPMRKPRDESVIHAPRRAVNLTPEEKRLAVRNALRYFPPKYHSEMAEEFAHELLTYGHIYMYRFVPEFEVRAYPIDEYDANCVEAAAIMLMIMNNLDPKVAQYPQELVTYGGNGQVFSNWAQFWLAMEYLSKLNADQCLVMSSGHPLGVYPSFTTSPRLIISNGMVIPNYSSRENYDRLFALGVTMYGQMTAGSFCYIGPQGIVHGTTITLLNAARKYLNCDDMSGVVFVSSGLGGMSGAQAKAAVICGCVAVIAEVDSAALRKRKNQGWLIEVIDDLNSLMERIRFVKRRKIATSIGYTGNVVDLWERLVAEYRKTNELLVDLGSDQTSCHNPFNGGYFPVQLSYSEALSVMEREPKRFRELCEESLRRHVNAINTLSEAGMHFWDYGNAFLLEAHRAGANVGANSTSRGLEFRYPSYVQHIMGDIFSLGFGPFRWVCCSGRQLDLDQTDAIAQRVLEEIVASSSGDDMPEEVKQNYRDNIKWIAEAKHHSLVVGSLARILYSDQIGRVSIALAFNDAVKSGVLAQPIVVSRDHHDVSGADSPFRETSNVYDGSSFTADMVVNTVIGNASRGPTWVALHNGGGVGFGEALNCGFGLLLDGTEQAANKAVNILHWDVMNGVSRRAWSGNPYAIQTAQRAVKRDNNVFVTIPNEVHDSIIEKLNIY